MKPISQQTSGHCLNGLQHVYKRRNISFNHCRSAKMEKTVVTSCVFLLFISSLLLVDGMVAFPKPGGIFKVLNGTFFLSQVLVKYTTSCLLHLTQFQFCAFQIQLKCPYIFHSTPAFGAGGISYCTQAIPLSVLLSLLRSKEEHPHPQLL